MWGKVPETVKCPRNDCEHYDSNTDEYPCNVCTCNHSSDLFGRTFNYRHKEVEQVCERNSQQKPSMPDSST